MKRIVLVPLVLLSLAGCGYSNHESTPDVAASDVVGPWVATGPDGESAVLDFAQDGSVAVSGLPDDLWPSTDTEPDWDAQSDRANGSWSIQETITDGRPWMYVSMDRVDGPPAYSGKVYFEGEGDGLVLQVYLGEGDEDPEILEFTRG
jgi:hypothetical protein